MKNTYPENFPTHFNLRPYEGAENSGIEALELGKHAIIVKFKTDGIYLYDEKRPGKQQIREMKEKALKGAQLATYINQNIRENFAAKWNQVLRRFEPKRK